VGLHPGEAGAFDWDVDPVGETVPRFQAEVAEAAVVPAVADNSFVVPGP
jgi:hypothetical protein